MYMGQMLNDILLMVTGIKYIMLIDASFRYHKLKFNEKSSYLRTFSCPFVRYQYIRLLFGAALTDDMFQKKIKGLFNDIPNVFGIADDILIAGFDADGRAHDVKIE